MSEEGWIIELKEQLERFGVPEEWEQWPIDFWLTYYEDGYPPEVTAAMVVFSE